MCESLMDEDDGVIVVLSVDGNGAKSWSSMATALHQAIAGKLMRLEQTQTRAMNQAALFGVIRLG